jgi:Zn-dependent peptidase ImmA (M78 family)
MTNNLLDEDQRIKIASEAEKLLDEQDLSQNKWVLISKILMNENIELKEGDFRDISGMLIKGQDSKWTIFINKEDSANRKLFTIAHELGHYKLHAAESLKFIDGQLGEQYWNRDEGTKYQKFEIEANEFAANLLMPRKVIEKELGDMAGKKINQEHILTLANKMGVSTLAMLTRLKNLDYVD